MRQARPDQSPIGTSHAPAHPSPPNWGQVDMDWLARHDLNLKEVGNLVLKAMELLHVPDGTRPQIVRGRGQMALDALREAKAKLDVAMVPFDGPFVNTSTGR